VAGGRVTTPATTNQTELWDGTSWTSSATLGTAGYLGATAGGPGLSSGLYAGGGRGPGAASSATEEFNSTIFSPATGAWASGGNMNTARSRLAGAGIQTSSVIFGGKIAPGSSAATEKYDGSTWTSSGNMGTARYGLAGFGTQTAAAGAGGYINPGGIQNATEEFNGSTWSPGGNLGTGRYVLAAAGTQTAGLVFGGAATIPSAGSTNTELYNGTSWTSSPNGLNSARKG
jgi:hypothetical protein